MSYTSEDLQSVQEAIIKLATGERVVQVRVGDQLIEYAPADMEALRTLKGEISLALSTAETRPRYVRTTTSKGVF